MRTLGIVRGKHTKKTAAFVRTCLAFCYITIPSMEEVFSRLYLYLVSATCALLNGSLPQEEAFLKVCERAILPPLLLSFIYIYHYD